MEQKETTFSKYNRSFWTYTIEALIIALVILVPIAFYPRCITVFLPAKEAVSSVLVLLALMFWFLKMISREEIKFTSKPFNFPVLSFIAICLFSLIWSDVFFVSLKELPLFLAGPLLYFVITNNISDGRSIRRILNVLLIVGSLFGIYGILQYNGVDFSFWTRNIERQQVFGLFGNVNYFAEYLIVPLPIAVSLLFASKNKMKKLLLLIGTLAMGSSLILTFTRGSYLGFGVSLIFMFLLFLISRGKNFLKKNRKIFIIILAVIIIITFLFIIPTPLNKSGTAIERIKSRISISQLTQGYEIKRRVATWKYTVLMIKDHPLLGSGIGTFKYNTLKYQAEFFDQGENRSLYPYGFADKAHNEYLQLWAEMGIVGLGIFVWLMISYFNYGLKILRKSKDSSKQGIIIGLMSSVVAVLIDGIFGFPLHLPATVILFWLALALTIIMGKFDPELEGDIIIGTVSSSVLKKDQKDREKKEVINKHNRNQANYKKIIHDFKPIFYILIFILFIFLCFTVTRPFIARIYWFYATRELSQNNLNESIKINEKALKWDPYFGEVYYDIGKVLQSKKIYTISLEYFQKATKYCDSPNLPKDFAMLYLMRNQFEEAAVKLKQAISYQKTDQAMLPFYCDLGSIYLRLKRHDLAEIALKKALQINPDYTNAHYRLAGVYLEQKKILEAQEELQKVIELAPESLEAKNAQNMMQQVAQEKLKVTPTETDNP